MLDNLFDATTVDPWQAPAPVVNPWSQPSVIKPIPKPDFADNEELKKSYGIALATAENAFQAGLSIFPGETAKALWASTNWLNDPIVIANRDAYKKTLRKASKPLDKEELLEEILARARNAFEDKDAASLLKLYSEVAGFTGKAADQAPTVVDNSTKFMSIKFVSPQGKEITQIDQVQNTTSKIVNELPKLKLVSGSR